MAADVITFTVDIALANGNVATTREARRQLIDQTTADYIVGDVSTTTGEASFSISAMTNPGLMYVKNIDPTNSIKIGFATGNLHLLWKAGEAFVVRIEPAAVSVFHQASAGTPKFEYLILED
jgi:hypothetical protein